MSRTDTGDGLLLEYGETGDATVDGGELIVTLAVTICANEAELSALLDFVQEKATNLMKEGDE